MTSSDPPPKAQNCHGVKGSVSKGSPTIGALSVGHVPMHGWILTDLAGGHHLQALLVCADATSGAQVTLVEGTPVWGRVVGEMGVQVSAPSASHHPGQNLSVYLEICSGASTPPKHLLSPTTSAWPLAPQSPAGANPLLDPILQQPWLLTPTYYLPGS